MAGAVCSVGHGARRHWWAWWFATATVAGASLAGGAGELLRVIVPALDGPLSTSFVVVLLGFVLAIESRVFPVPTIRRQVDPRLWSISPSVAAVGWGFQLGLGITTLVTSGGLYVLLLLNWLTDMPFLSLVGLVGFGVARGLEPCAAVALGSPTSMLSSLTGVQRFLPALIVSAMTGITVVQSPIWL
jgi:hypothetical protein